MKITRKTFDEVMFPCYNPMDMVIKRAHGSYVYDNEGRRYVDFTSGIAVNVLGHTPKGVVRVIKNAAQNLMHVSNIFTNEYTLGLALKLQKITGFERFFFVNSGTEANEAALKLARRAAFEDFGKDKDEIISFSNSFHGRTFFSVTVGGHEEYSDGFGPKPGAVTHIPYNDVDLFCKTISDRTCAVILEPIQGEGGIIKASPLFLKEVRELCTKHHALLIFDEVQTGVGRTGTFYAYESTGVKPDILTSAKGLAAGLPIGAVMTSKMIASHFGPGTHGSTFGGNPLACAVGQYVVDKVSSPKFLDKVKHMHDYLEGEILKINDTEDVFAMIRGEGLLMGLVLKEPYLKKSALLQKCCFKEGLLTLTAHENVLRLAPNLNLSKKAADEGLNLLHKAILRFKTECSLTKS